MGIQESAMQLYKSIIELHNVIKVWSYVMLIWKSIIDWCQTAIQNILVKHQNTIYGAPQFDIWIFIIQFMKIHNYKLRCSINAPDLWSYRFEIWNFIFKIMDLHKLNMELYKTFIEIHKSIVEHHISAKEVHNSYLWSSIIIDMTWLSGDSCPSLIFTYESTYIFMELHNLSYGAP